MREEGSGCLHLVTIEEPPAVDTREWKLPEQDKGPGVKKDSQGK